MFTVEQGRVVSVSETGLIVGLSGRKGKWEVPFWKMGKYAFGEEGPEIQPPPLDGEKVIPGEGKPVIVAMDWEPESGKALSWAPIPDAVVIKLTP